MYSFQDVVKSHCCMSCGLCFGNAREISRQRGLYIPKEISDNRNFICCPGKGYDIVRLGASRETSIQHPDLGCFDSLGAVCAKDSDILKRASSGGAMTCLAWYLLCSNQVDGVVTTKLEIRNGCITPVTFVAKTKSELCVAQGSKYMPVPALHNLDNLLEEGKQYLFIGTPCQIAGIRMLQENKNCWANRIRFTVGNFCGGFRDLRELSSILNQLDISSKDISDFSYRGDGQPGYMTIHLRSGRQVRLGYPGYAKMTGYPVIRRCKLCVDATAELADFSCGDAWLPRFLEKHESRSIVITRSSEATKIVKKMTDEKFWDFESLTAAEVIESQRTNIFSKKRRQNARRKLFSCLLQNLPAFDGGFDQGPCNIYLELKVLLSHLFFYYLQIFHLYQPVSRWLKRNKTRIEWK